MYLDGFTTDRLIIRPVTERDIPVWTDFFMDDTVFEYIGINPDINPCDNSRTWIERQLTRYQNNDYGLMALIDNESMEMVGMSGIITMNVESDRELEVGYHIIERFRGRGYAVEAAKVFMDYVFENNLADTFFAVIHIDNINSQTVAGKLGLKRERRTTCMNKPSFRYVISREEWANQVKADRRSSV